MNKKEKITMAIMGLIIILVLIMNVIIYNRNPENFSYMDWLALINFIFIAYIYIVSVIYQHSFSKDTKQQPYEYKKPLKTRKKWSILYLIGNLFLLFIISSAMFIFYPDGRIYFYFMVIIFIVFIYTFIKNLLILIRYEQIDPNEKYTFFGHIKPE